MMANNWPRMHGKDRYIAFLRDVSLLMGHHIHTVSMADGERCDGGDTECSLWNRQLEELRDEG